MLRVIRPGTRCLPEMLGVSFGKPVGQIPRATFQPEKTIPKQETATPDKNFIESSPQSIFKLPF